MFTHFANVVDTVEWDSNCLKLQLKNTIFHLGAELKNLVGFEGIEDQTEISDRQRKFFNNLLNPDFEKSLSRSEQDILETLYFKAFSHMFKRDIIMISDKSFYEIGYGNFRSPLIIFFDKESETYNSLTSPKPFLNFKASLSKNVEHYTGDDIAKQIFRILKSKVAHNFITWYQNLSYVT